MTSTSGVPTLLKEARHKARLTQAQLAAAAGTAQPNIAAYETGRLEPRLDTLARLIEACGANLDIVVTPKVRRGARSLAELAPVMAQDIERNGPRDAWNDALDFVDDYRGSSTAGRASLIAERPDITGDTRVDALIAALAEFVSTEAGVPIPAWSWEAGRRTEPWWFVAGGPPAFQNWALQEAPASFSRRGLFISKEAFDRV